MKKLLLFIFALFLWTGAWADAPVNLALNKTVTQIYTPSSPNPESLPTLSNVTDGDNSTNAMLQINSTAGTDIAALCIDLTEANENTRIGLISVIQDGRHATQYKIYGTSTAPDTYASKSDLTTAAESWTLLVNCTNDDNGGGDNTIYTKTYSTPNNSGFRYIIFVPTANAYGVSLRELVVYEYYEQVYTSFAPTSGEYIYNAAQEVTLSLMDQYGKPYFGSVTSILFDQAKFGYAHNESKPSFTFGADFPESVDDLQVTADDNTVAKTFGFLKNTPSTDIIPAIDNDASYIIFSAEKNEVHDVWNTFDGDCTSQISNFSINDKSARLIKTMNYVGMKNNTLSSSTDMTGLVLDIFVTKAHSAANCHIKAEGINTLNFSSALTKGWNHVVLSNFTPTTLSGLTTNTTLFIRIDDVASDEEVVIYNLYYTKEAASFNPSLVTNITVTAASSSIAKGNTTQLTVKDQADNTIEAENITFESSNPSVATVDADGVVTAVAPGSVTITATVTGNNTVSNTVDITVTEAPLGYDITSGNHTVHITPYHYNGTNNYKLVITSTEEMEGLGGSFWNINGVGGTDMRSNAGTQTYNVSEDKHTITITNTSTSAPTIYTPLYVLMPGSEVSFTSVQNTDLNWIDVQAVTISAAKWASFSSTNALDFGKVDGLTAYYATSNDDTKISYDTVDKTPASTGVILGGAEGTYDVPVIASAPALANTNLLHSTASGSYTLVADDVNYVYVFGKVGSDIGFVKGLESYTVGANKAYLRLTEALSAKGFELIGLPGTEEPSETDGINKITPSLSEANAVYNLAGQRVGNDYKGLVIVNGKKYLRK